MIRTASHDFQYNPVFDGENIAETHYIAVFKGFIHWSRAAAIMASSPSKTALRLYLVAAAAHAYLYVSKNCTPAFKVQSLFFIVWPKAVVTGTSDN